MITGTTENTWPGWVPGCFVHEVFTCSCGNHTNGTFIIGPTNTNVPLEGEDGWLHQRSRLGGWIGLFDAAYVPPEPRELRAERPPTAGRPAVAPVFRREPRRNPRSASRRLKAEASP